MEKTTQSNIDTAVKKHLGFAMFLAIIPVIFIQSIMLFSGDRQLESLLITVLPLSTVGVCAHLIKCVLTELSETKGKL
jgi:hypothetical protein